MSYYEGDKVEVTCTDTDQTMQGEIHRAKGNTLWVVINPNVPVIPLSLSKSGLYVGNAAGMEFTVGRAKIKI